MSDDSKKNLKKSRIILRVILIVVLALAGILVLVSLIGRFIIKSGGDRSGGDLSAPKIYYKSDLDAITGVQLRESEDKMGDQECVRYWNNRNVPTIYDSLTFYVYKNERKANKALKYIKKNSFREITDEGDNYVQGWLKDVCDAEIEAYYYVSGNLLIETWVDGYSEWPTSVEDEVPEPSADPEAYNGDIKDLIKKTF